MKKYLMLILFIAIISFCYLVRLAKYYDFHKAEIHGRIDTVYRYKDYVMIYVDNNEYRIIPVSLNPKYPFDEMAKVGDTLDKPANRDTFTLIHEGDEAITYSVKKF